jgi:EAL domain-containing protein (putative c-di-GMP-specific phosphodiesterase class I)
MTSKPARAHHGVVPSPSPALAELLKSLGRSADGTSLIDLAIASAREHLGMDLSLLSEFRDGRQVYRRISGSAERFGMREDGSRPLAETYCQRVVAGELEGVIGDTAAHPAVGDLAVTAEAGIGAYVGVPVRMANGELYGTLCCLSREPDATLRERDARFLEVLATLLGEEIGRERAQVERRRALDERVGAVLREGRLSSVFQPIVALADRRVVGLEALTRVTGEDYAVADLFDDAREVGLGVELELASVAAALAQLDRIPAPVYVSVNVTPATLAAAGFAELLRGLDARRVLVEVTEHAVADSYDVLHGAMAGIRSLGARFAIDDVGAGYAGLNHLLRLAPDVIKLDRFLSSGIEADPARQAIAAAAAAFAASARTAVIAEGIETEAQHDFLQRLGIRYGQGYLYGRPEPLIASERPVG